MRVIRNGKDMTFAARCSHCASYMEYTLEDVQTDKWAPQHYIVCPVCGKTIEVWLQTLEEIEAYKSIVHYPTITDDQHEKDAGEPHEGGQG